MNHELYWLCLNVRAASRVFAWLTFLFVVAIDALEEIDAEDVEVETQDGVLKVSGPYNKTWVLNTHGATRQLWLSSPITYVPSISILYPCCQLHD